MYVYIYIYIYIKKTHLKNLKIILFRMGQCRLTDKRKAQYHRLRPL